MKPFKYVAAVILWLFVCISVYADGNAPLQHKAKEAALHKDEPEARMFLIAVIDTNDKDIGDRCATDLDEISFAFEDLAAWLDVEEIPKIIEGDDFSKAAVSDAIDNWLKLQEPDRNDIIIFYYSGHGFRYPNDVSGYPRMWLKTADDQNIATTNLSIEEDIYNRIVKMGAGFNLVLSDCCNTTAAGDNANFDNVTVPNPAKVAHKRDDNEEDNADNDMDNGNILFMPKSPVSVLATAAGKSELAGGKADGGGFFTQYFLEALSKCVFETAIAPEWQNIFKYAGDEAGYWARSAPCPNAKHNDQGRCIQTAEFKIDTSN